jgi:hypothetical protein
MMTPGSAIAKLTDEGGPNVFRVYGRDDRQGMMVGDYLADHWADKEIAILEIEPVLAMLGPKAAEYRLTGETTTRMAADATFRPCATFTPPVTANTSRCRRLQGMAERLLRATRPISRSTLMCASARC